MDACCQGNNNWGWVNMVPMVTGITKIEIPKANNHVSSELSDKATPLHGD